MQKYIFTLLILSSFSILSMSQNSFQNQFIRKHSLYSELGGNSGIFSANYDYLLPLTTYIKFAAGTGVGFMYIMSDTHSHFTGYLTPAGNFLIGKASHHLELGGSLQSGWDGLLVPAARVGYRYQPHAGGFLFRMGFTPLFKKDGKGYPWGGISVGMTL